MRHLRSISLTVQADKFLQSYDRQLLREGHPVDLVEQIAFSLYETLFERLPRGSLKGGADYVGLDPHNKGYSIYVFAEDFVSGVYSSCGNHVIVYSLSVRLPPVMEDRSAISAA